MASSFGGHSILDTDANGSAKIDSSAVASEEVTPRGRQKKPYTRPRLVAYGALYRWNREPDVTDADARARQPT